MLRTAREVPVLRETLELVKQFEGFEPRAYLCPAGVWTVGYGHTRGVTKSSVVTEMEADILLRRDLEAAAREVLMYVRVPLGKYQLAALTSFVFNVGAGNFGKSTLLRKLNAGDYAAVPSEMQRWVKATDPKTGRKRALEGLVRRRAAEAAMWNKS
jgi:lysozyme